MPDPAAAPNRGRILIVDDEEDIRNLLIYALLKVCMWGSDEGIVDWCSAGSWNERRYPLSGFEIPFRVRCR